MQVSLRAVVVPSEPGHPRPWRGRRAARPALSMSLVISQEFNKSICTPPHFAITPMSDATTTVAELRKIIGDFVAERDWSQFHSPKNVSMALAIEAAELMEHFQWLSTEDSRELAKDPNRLAEVGEELADVIGYSLALANELGLDVSNTIRAKMVKNIQKYPAAEFRGRYSRENDQHLNK